MRFVLSVTLALLCGAGAEAATFYTYPRAGALDGSEIVGPIYKNGQAMSATIGQIAGAGSALGAVSVTAAGNSQGTATPITTASSNVVAASAGQGVILSASQSVQVVFNSMAVTINVYPPVGASIMSLATNLPGGVIGYGQATFRQNTPGHWVAS